MGLEIRAARPEEMEELKRVAHASLLVTISADMSPELTLCAFKDGKLATSYVAWELTMRLNGGDIPIAGVTMVGTLPVFRRHGFLKKVTAAHFKQLYEQGEMPIAALHASRSAIYQRYGYAVVQTRNTYKVEPIYLEFADIKPVTGTFRELGDDDFELLADLYRSFISDRTGYLVRSPEIWQKGVLAPPREGSALARIAYEENGEPLGYVIYTANLKREAREMLKHDLFIRDFIWLGPSAYRAIWEYFKRMDLVEHVTWQRAPADDPLPHLLMEPRMLNISSWAGLMGRIIDIEKAVPRRHYEAEGDLTFEIIDEICPWNQGRWKLETSGVESRVSRTDMNPQVVMPVSTLALLVFGQLSATEAARMGRLEAHEPGALPLWDNIMRTRYRTSHADFF